MSSVKHVMKVLRRNAELDEFLARELSTAGYDGSDVQTTPIGTRITIYVTRPGLVIGRRGLGIKDLTERIAQHFNLKNPQIAVAEVEIPELSPRIMCTRIAQQVERGVAFRRAAIWSLNTIMAAGALGTEVVVAGKLRTDRSRFDKYRAGVVPKSGEVKRAVVREAVTDILLKAGLCGIKVKIAVREAALPEVEVKSPQAAEAVAEKGSAPVEGKAAEGTQ